MNTGDSVFFRAQAEKDFFVPLTAYKEETQCPARKF
jgi:hypothetical protein